MRTPLTPDDQELRDLLRNCLDNVPSLVVGSLTAEPGAVAEYPVTVIDVVTGGATWKLVVERKDNGQIRFVRDAISTLKLCTSRFENACGVLVAPYISEKGARLLKEHNISYVDLAGNCLLSFAGVYIERRGFPNPFARREPHRSLFTPKSSRIVRALLTSPRKEWTATDLADEVGVSISLVSHVRRLLADREWTSAKSKKIKLVNPEEVLQEWARHYSYEKNTIRRYYSMASTAATEESLMKAAESTGGRVALTGMSGAARLNPSARYNRVMAYVETITDRLIDECRLREVPSGENVWLLEPYDEGVFYAATKTGESLVVSPVQVYLDLLGVKGRGEDVAEIIYTTILEGTW
jgi:hypothetical protein